jgi:tetraacyldisaccharide 4'-kinase
VTRSPLDALWRGQSVLARAGRASLFPISALHGVVVRGRNALYDREILRSTEPALPTISVGNLSVGGTGKTPVAAWLARELAARGARPAIVLRGYGGDEPLVHRVLNPGIPVIVDADRARGAGAARENGATVIVLDDAFQHRSVRRQIDLALVSADAWDGTNHLLPGGPWREPLRSLRRATLTIITRKAADTERVNQVRSAIVAAAPAANVAVARLAPVALERVPPNSTLGSADATPREALAPDETIRMPLDELSGRRVVAASAIGDPAAFERQLEAAGARVTGLRFADHHRFTRADVDAIRGGAGDGSLLVCTLKDAVKLAPLWSVEAPALWYVSQRPVLEQGGEQLGAMLDQLAAAARTSP